MNENVVPVAEENDVPRENFRGMLHLPSFWFSILILCLPLLILFPGINKFLYPGSGSPFSDIAITHFPNAVFLLQSMARWGEIPMWSPTILSGYPFAANPLSGLWYPFGWLAYILPLPLGFNLLAALHLVWAGIGMYLLMKEEGLGHASALLSGVAFSLLPKFYSHLAAGHLTLLYAIPWTPWLLLYQRYAGAPAGTHPRFRIPPGVIFGLILLADPRWGAFVFLLWWVYACANHRQKFSKLILDLFIQTILGLLLAAPLLVPLIEFSSLSTRAALRPDEILIYSLPLVNLVGILFPNSKGLHEWVLYSGGAIILLAVVGSLSGFLGRKKYFWLSLTMISAVVALGLYIPGSSYIAKLPLINLLRVPTRALFLTGMGIAGLAGYGFETIQKGMKSTQLRKILLFIFSIAGFSILLTLGMRFTLGEVAPGSIWGTAMIVLGTILITAKSRDKLKQNIWIPLVFILVVLDLGFVNISSYQPRVRAEVLSDRYSIAEYISTKEGIFRTYSPSYSVPQQTAVQFNIQMADGVDPLQINQYVEFMDKATGVPREGYSVTVPPYANGDPGEDNADYLPHPKLLGILNVRYVIADFEVQAEGLDFERQIEGVNIYRNRYQMPRAWIVPVDEKDKSIPTDIKIIESDPNKRIINASGPGKLVLSEIFYPGWQVKINGTKSELSTEFNLLMSVELGPGFQEVEFSFFPVSLIAGLALFACGLLALIVLTWHRKIKLNSKILKPNQN